MQPIIRTFVLPGAALATALLSACSPTPTREPQVAVAAPLQRLELPEKPARRLSAGVNYATQGVSTVLTDDQATTTPDPQAPRLDDGGEGHGSVVLEAYPHERLGIGLEIRAIEEDDLADQMRGHLRLHVVDAGPYSVALTGAYGERSYHYLMNHVEDSGFFGGGHLVDEAQTSIRSRERDFALIAGWRATDNLLVFGGPFFYEQPYAGTHTDYAPPADGSGSSGSSGSSGGLDGLLGGEEEEVGAESGTPVTTAFAGEVSMTGVNAGLAVSLGVPELRLIAEVVSARIDSGAQSDRTTGVSLAFRGDFGGRMPRR